MRFLKGISLRNLGVRAMRDKIKSLNKQLKSHDSELFCQETRAGRIDVYRKSKWGSKPPEFIFCLTEDWTVNSRPVPWGNDVVINRIKAHDLWRDDNFIEEVLADQEKEPERQEKALRNSIESFLYDFRRQFARATDSVNTANLKKIYRKGL